MSRFITADLIRISRELNEASDSLNKPIVELDEELQKLNIGLSTWITAECGDLDEPKSSWKLELGYDKIESKWGIAIRETIRSAELPETINTWIFARAPRVYRTAVIDKIPELIERLAKIAEKTVCKLKTVTQKLEGMR